MWKKDKKGNVSITLSQNDFTGLLIMCGYATGAASKQDKKLMESFIRLTNKINQGNPNFGPYKEGRVLAALDEF